MADIASAWPALLLAQGVSDGSSLQHFSAAHSRSQTCLGALRRLGLDELPPSVLVAGADRCEGESAHAVFRTFEGLALHFMEGPHREMHLTLQGPNVQLPEPHRTSRDAAAVSLLVTRLPPDGCTARLLATPTLAGARGAGFRLHLRFSRSPVGPPPPGEETPPSPRPTLLFAPNAGVWGYGDSWLSALSFASARLRVPCVVTAYCRSEAEADEEALLAAGLALAWGAEPNPWASLQPWRPTCERGAAEEEGAEARAENSWWLCVAAA